MRSEEHISPSSSISAPGDRATLKDRQDLCAFRSTQFSNDAVGDDFADVSSEKKFIVLSDDIWVSRKEKLQALMKKEATVRSDPRRSPDVPVSDTVSDHREFTNPSDRQTPKEAASLGEEKDIQNDTDHSSHASQTKEGTQVHQNGDEGNLEGDPQGFRPPPFRWQGFDRGRSSYIDHNDYDLFAVPSTSTSTETSRSTSLKQLSAESPSSNEDAMLQKCCCMRKISISSIFKSVRPWFSRNRTSTAQGSGPKRSAPKKPRHRLATFYNYVLI